MPFIEQFGQQLAGNAANAGMGLLFQGLANQQNFIQAKKMQALQIKGSKELTDYNRRSQFQMWLDTNFPAQVAQAEAAGLNPGLLYGGAGGGGATTGAGGGAMPSGGAQQSASPIGMQILTTAQLKLLEAQTNKTNAEAEQIRGVDTELKTTQISSLTQGINNQKAVEQLTKVETELKKLEQQVANATTDEKIDMMEWGSLKILEELHQAQQDTFIKVATRNNQIDIVKTELVSMVLKNSLTQAQTKATEKGIEVSEAQIKKMAGDLINATRGLDQQAQQIEIDKWFKEAQIKLGVTNTVLGTLKSVIGKN